MSNSVKASVGEIMNDRLETIGLLNTAHEAAMKMADRNVSSLVVLDDKGKAVGILTERDLVRWVCTKNIPSSSVIIQNTISSPIKTIAPDTPIDEVADIMIRNKIRHIVVVADENCEPIGMVSAMDIVAFVRENSDTMAQVTREVLEALEKEGRI